MSNTHGIADAPAEGRLFWGDSSRGFIRAGGLPDVPASSLTLDPFATLGYGRKGESLEYIDQAAASVTVPDSPVVWVAIDADTHGVDIGSWTREKGTHYLYQPSAERPADPPNGTLCVRVTVAGSVITAVEDYRPSNPQTAVRRATDPLFGLSADGVTPADVGLKVLFDAPNSVADLEGLAFAVTGEVVITANDLLIQNGKLVASALIAGDSAIVRASGINGLRLDNIDFDCDLKRRWAVDCALDCTNLRFTDVDAFHYTDIASTAFHVPSTASVTLRAAPVMQRTVFISIIKNASGGSLPDAGTNPDVPGTGYATAVNAVDALGREAPVFLAGTTGINRAFDSGSNTGAITITWEPNPLARSYRVYFTNLDINGTWERYYSVPVDPASPDPYSFTITEGDQRVAALIDTVVSVPSPSGTFQNEIFTDYFFKQSQQLTDGQAAYTGTNASQVLTVNNDAQRLDVSWPAAVGNATVAQYVVMVSRPNTGGYDHFNEVVETGSISTTFQYVGTVGYLAYPWGNVDQVPALGYNPRILGGSGIELVHGSRHQASERTGFDADYQITRFENNTADHIDGGVVSFSGITYSLSKAGTTGALLYWRVGEFGNNENWRGISFQPSSRLTWEAGRSFGLIGRQSMVQAYYSVSADNVTGDGTVYVLVPDTVEFDPQTNWTVGTGRFTAPFTAIYRAVVQVRYVNDTSTNAIVTIVKDPGGPGQIFYETATQNITVSAVNYIQNEAFVQLDAGQAMETRFAAEGGTLTVDVVGSTNRDTRVLVEIASLP